MKSLNFIENTMLAIGTLIGVANIETIIGIIYLVVQIAILITKVVLKVIDSYKKNDVKSAVKALEDAKEELDDLKEGTEDV